MLHHDFTQDDWPIPIKRRKDYKAHFARKNDLNEEPLDVFVRDAAEWQGWQEYRPKKNEFNRPFIFSLMRFYHETDTWLFGGVFKLLADHGSRYEVELLDVGSEFIGRLKIRHVHKRRTTRAYFEKHYDGMEVAEILREPYSGRQFPGYDDIDLPFKELETLIRNDRPDWKTALENMKGIYLISDISTNKQYVGSASGDQGIWSRWRDYAHNGHGGNVELRALVTDPSLDYCRANFRYALLEHRPAQTPDEVISQREKFWKRVLSTRGDQGLNRN